MKHYRDLNQGETIQSGDEYFFAGKWMPITPAFIGKQITVPVQHRRPFAIATDTSAAAAKLARMNDACANVHDDERDNIEFVPWHGGECPAPDGHCVSLRFRNGIVVMTPEPSAHHRNWKHDNHPYDIVGYFDHTEAEREAGLIDVNDADETTGVLTAFAKDLASKQTELDPETKAAVTMVAWDLYATDVVDMQDSQQEWVNGIPQTGVVCEMTDEADNFIEVKIIGNEEGFAIGWAKNPTSIFKRLFYSNLPRDFRPLQPEQKPDDLDSLIYDIAQNVIRPYAEDESNGVIIKGYFPLAEMLVRWLKSTGRLTQGGGDE